MQINREGEGGRKRDSLREEGEWQGGRDGGREVEGKQARSEASQLMKCL